MWRVILSVVGGIVAWSVIAAVINHGLRFGLPGYSEAEPTAAFTLAMQIARLLMGVVAAIGAGVALRVIAPESTRAPWITGLVMLAAFVPIHIHVWARFPVWYHLFFLISSPLLVLLGARLRAPSANS